MALLESLSEEMSCPSKPLNETTESFARLSPRWCDRRKPLFRPPGNGVEVEAAQLAQAACRRGRLRRGVHRSLPVSQTPRISF